MHEKLPCETFWDLKNKSRIFIAIWFAIFTLTKHQGENRPHFTCRRPIPFPLWGTQGMGGLRTPSSDATNNDGALFQSLGGYALLFVPKPYILFQNLIHHKSMNKYILMKKYFSIWFHTKSSLLRTKFPEEDIGGNFTDVLQISGLQSLHLGSRCHCIPQRYLPSQGEKNPTRLRKPFQEMPLNPYGSLLAWDCCWVFHFKWVSNYLYVVLKNISKKESK